MTTKRPHTIRERNGQLDFEGPDGTLHIYAAYDGGFFLHTRNTDKRISGVSITNHELIELAAALVRLAQDDAREPT